MDAHQSAWGEVVASKVIENLRKRKMEGSYAPTAKQACDEILAMIKEGSSVYRGGSITTANIGFWDRLSEIPGVKVVNPYEPSISKEEAYNRRRMGFQSDYMVTSTNAITMDGLLVNLDGTGNRVAGMIFGPSKVILAVSINKIVKDLDAAKERIKRYSAPINARRLGYKTPCAVTGICSECESPQRICNVWSIIEGQLIPGRIHVKFIGADLGY
jgi:hypothetical protein